ncbi:hypothetical protein [Aureimonas glaciei]|uniref:Uncharacterized protein n=1 Tax=Aureimonas glaciei TaxID=1776957 RepID=A0A916XZY7_9HYPH|nr:hypothetical protein [Aureimonas glaciei]GGD24397.1 hypothetical protein GCM10011335_29120 [Aureimonas glaciei]
MSDPVLTWPFEVLTPATMSFNMRARNTAGSRSLSGLSQDIASGAGGWVARYSKVAIIDQNKAKRFYAIAAMLQGRLNPLLVTLYDERRAPFPASQPKPYKSIPFSDGAYFSDGAGFYEAVIQAVLASGMARGATTATIIMQFGGEIEPGQHFSIGMRLYRVVTASYSSGPTQTVTFWPPARDAASAGAAVEFDRPVCKMKLADDNMMDVELDRDTWGYPNVDFIEDLS